MRKYKELLIGLIIIGLVVFLGFLPFSKSPSLGGPVRTEFQTLLDKANAGEILTYKEFSKFIELYNKEIQKENDAGRKFDISNVNLGIKDILRKTSEKLEK